MKQKISIYVKMYLASFVFLALCGLFCFLGLCKITWYSWTICAVSAAAFAVLYVLSAKKINTDKKYNAAEAYVFYKKYYSLYQSDTISEKHLERTAKKLGAEGKFTASELKEIYQFGKSIANEGGK